MFNFAFVYDLQAFKPSRVEIEKKNGDMKFFASPETTNVKRLHGAIFFHSILSQIAHSYSLYLPLTSTSLQKLKIFLPL